MGQSLLTKYVALKQEAEAIQEKLERMQNDPNLQREFEFKDKLTQLMKEFDKSASDVLVLLAPESGATTAATSTGRAKRKLKVYKNPATGEVVETRGGNQKTIKAWKDEHGHDTVESWVVDTKD
ncbi:DNA binding protein [Halomonas elongata]|uniref:histone-like nucleoid-structuring protein, MvaT/MvaU family n=1 Tax=Halomonas elongata TaxID=2746 RepID=UPI00255AC0ED|nr:histone-like nucleoid-structuring protein, MvaT/MvaU family [Halomonas elongata]MDL4860777.1 DNA binding protein [Halomonas elongata]